MKKISISILILIMVVLQSCGSKKKIIYVQDLDEYDNSALVYTSTKIQPNDILKVEVSDLNPVVAAPFNMMVSGGGQTSVDMMRLNGYLVTPKGAIMLPILNEMSVGGLTPTEAEMKIKQTLIDEGYLVNPTVQVRVLNNKFTVLGEVRAPGVLNFTEQSISLLNAIGMAGDLTYAGLRRDVQIIREIDGKRLVYHVDLTTAKWMSNPDYRIRQNDVIYVKPNKAKSNSERVIKDPLQILGILSTIGAIILLIRN
ncbi:polysaccharide biosynthesis/export family protein [Flavobacterium algicola]|uniref:polysaccharide biosynthesis/export family protein n=1 Tax=Flavobacterium algicola TaxID=556529 RepID=UPI001EFE13BF|nr:polysaccharide biosynthesis/export family protein [Flavobacterium algicola]MCG9793529.1 polysaccharide biosynthesis/export family protein [Flavobacterium algicola]